MKRVGRRKIYVVDEVITTEHNDTSKDGGRENRCCMKVSKKKKRVEGLYFSLPGCLAALGLGCDNDGDDDSDDSKDRHHDANDNEEELLVLPPQGLLQTLALLFELACIIRKLI